MPLESNSATSASSATTLDPNFAPVAEQWAPSMGTLLSLPTSFLCYEVLKRAIDIMGSLIVIALSLPVLACVGVLIWWTDRGPILFCQTRVGRGGRHFSCYKLRSMVVDAERAKESLLHQNRHGDQRTFKMIDDPRITRIGRFARKYSIDELPQLFNVLIGDMSLVGPRPPVPSEVALYSQLDSRRLEVKPGLTCLWQVSGRGDLPFPEQVKLDVAYIERRGLWTDLQILLQTIPAVLLAKGAY